MTYQNEGFNKILDFGKLWSEKFGNLPLPLGLDVVRKDLGTELAKKITKGLKESIKYGYEHKEESIPYSLQFGRGLNSTLGERFVKMYVSDLTIDMGERGKKGIETLFKLGAQKNLLQKIKNIDLV